MTHGRTPKSTLALTNKVSPVQNTELESWRVGPDLNAVKVRINGKTQRLIFMR